MSGQNSKKKPIKLPGWKELLNEHINALHTAPPGYSTVEEIAEETHCSITKARDMIRRLHKEGRVDAVRIIGKNGRPTWVYKD